MEPGQSLLVTGILLGLGAAAPIGPVNVEMARRSLQNGLSSGVALGLGAVTVDVIYCVLASTGSAKLSENSWIGWPIAIAGVLLLTYMGCSSIRNARFSARQPPEQSRRVHPGGGYATGLAMTATNPMTLVFWFTVIAGVIPQPRRNDLPIICVGVFIGTIVWVLGFCSLLSFAGRFRKRWWMAAADEFGGVMLLGLAGAALLRALRGTL